MYYFFSFLSIFFAIVVAAAINSEEPKVKSPEKLPEYEQSLRKSNLILVTVLIFLCLSQIIPIVDSCMPAIEKEVEVFEYYRHTETHYFTPILKAEYKYSAPSCWPCVVAMIILAAYIFHRLFYVQNQVDKYRTRFEKEKLSNERMAEKERLRQEAKDKLFAYIRANYGEPDKIIHTIEYYSIPKWDKAVYVMIASKVLYYDEKTIHFDDILYCTLVDNGHVETKLTGITTSTTSSDNGSVVGRAVVGGLIAGGAGAIIGGATASSKTTSNTKSNSVSKTVHDYKIVINVKDIVNPIIEIPFGSYEQAARELLATINAIMAL